MKRPISRRGLPQFNSLHIGKLVAVVDELICDRVASLFYSIERIQYVFIHLCLSVFICGQLPCARRPPFATYEAPHSYQSGYWAFKVCHR